jgi:hypothetical protein
MLDLLNSLEQIPKHIETVLQQSDHILNVTEGVVNRDNWLFLGRGTNYPVALEGALKLKEISNLLNKISLMEKKFKSLQSSSNKLTLNNKLLLSNNEKGASFRSQLEHENESLKGDVVKATELVSSINKKGVNLRSQLEMENQNLKEDVRKAEKRNGTLSNQNDDLHLLLDESEGANSSLLKKLNTQEAIKDPIQVKESLIKAEEVIETSVEVKEILVKAEEVIIKTPEEVKEVKEVKEVIKAPVEKEPLFIIVPPVENGKEVIVGSKSKLHAFLNRHKIEAGYHRRISIDEGAFKIVDTKNIKQNNNINVKNRATSQIKTIIEGDYRGDSISLRTVFAVNREDLFIPIY